MASVFFGVVLSVLMTSMQYGSYDSMINNVVKFYSGYAQIFTEAYHENKTINNTMELTDSIKAIVKQAPHITYMAPRLEYFALASSEELTKGALIVGIDPEMESHVTDVAKWVEAGQYINQGDDGVMVSINLANYLKIKVGDTLVLYGQGYHGITAADLFPVRGILNFPSPDLNNQLIYMDIKTCQKFFGSPNRITSLILMVEDYHYLPTTMAYLKKVIDTPLEVMSWDELQPELVQMIEGDRAGGIFMKLILYLVVAFGIIGTIIMMMAERTRELGVTISIGMQRYSLATILYIETLLTGLVGSFIGIVVSIPLVVYLFKNPIPLTGNAAKTMIDMGMEPLMYFSQSPFVFYNQALTVFLITLIVGFIPVYKAFNLKLNQALKA